MPAGTITLTNGSTAVTGSSTTFTSDVDANGFIVATVGGTAYTLGIKSVESDTALTLTQAYDGPAASGVSFDYVPLATLNLITSALAAQVSYAVRGLNLDKTNWQQILTGTGNVTVTLPDGTTWTGPAWGYITTLLAGKAAKGANSDITSLTGLSTALSIAQGGTGAKTASDAWAALLNGRTAATARNDLSLGTSQVPYFSSIELSSATPFIDFHYGSGATDYNVRLINSSNNLLSCSGVFDVVQGIASRAGLGGAVDSNVPFFFYWNYVTTATGLYGFVGNTGLGNISFVAASDKMLKTEPVYAEDNDDALEQVKNWKVASFKYKARGIIPESDERLGFIANDMVKFSPECVKGDGLPDDYDIENDPNNTGYYTLDQIAMIAKLTQAIQAQQQLIENQSEVIATLQERIASLENAGS
ncbi:tail fiber domain-containing protein [Pantoea sp.]|uniref:tail fiber domain-containing protein n=1 Tax=Pantoea sp. TaxID=69393 RepID=UPI0028A8466B|nr:tail fiber domain-containing protein [Pantoea sp.]